MVVAMPGEYRRIRRLRHEDMEQIMAWDNDPEVFGLAGKKFRQGDDKEVWQNLLKDRNRLMFAIVGERGELVGDIELQQIIWRTKEAELRIAIGDKRYWSRGLGTEAVLEALHVAFELLSLRRIYLRVRADNARAIRVYQKAGFRFTGRLPASGRLAGMTDLMLMELSHERYQLASLRA